VRGAALRVHASVRQVPGSAGLPAAPDTGTTGAGCRGRSCGRERDDTSDPERVLQRPSGRPSHRGCRTRRDQQNSLCAGGATELPSRKAVSAAPRCVTTAPGPQQQKASFPRSEPQGAPGRIRTRDPLLRRQLLYPAELRAPGTQLCTPNVTRRPRQDRGVSRPGSASASPGDGRQGRITPRSVVRNSSLPAPGTASGGGREPVSGLQAPRKPVTERRMPGASRP
jgi:hypothetical protein